MRAWRWRRPLQTGVRGSKDDTAWASIRSGRHNCYRNIPSYRIRAHTFAFVTSPISAKRISDLGAVDVDAAVGAAMLPGRGIDLGALQDASRIKRKIKITSLFDFRSLLFCRTLPRLNMIIYSTPSGSNRIGGRESASRPHRKRMV